MIIAIEGIDGAGKNTLVTAMQRETGAAALAFPRYETSIHAQLAREALDGKMGDLTDSAYAMATLFALDRAGVADRLREYRSSSRVIILDRYVASNAAYSWARTGEQGIVDWVANLEFATLGLPRPDLQILLDTDPAEAGRRASRRAETNANRALDAYERDDSLQQRTYDAYLALAGKQWESEWLIGHEAADVMSRIPR